MPLLGHFGLILYHNVDKALLCGGAAEPAFNGGRVTAPMEIVLAGRATREFSGRQVPVEDITQQICRHWLRVRCESCHALRDTLQMRLSNEYKAGWNQYRHCFIVKQHRQDAT